MIDTSKIAGYDEMTAEQKLEAIQNADLSSLGLVAKATFDQTASDLAKAKKNAKAAAEQGNIDIEALNKMIAPLEEKNARSEKVAATMPKFVNLGMTADEAIAATNSLIDGDTDSVFTALTELTNRTVAEARKQALLNQKRPDGFAGKVSSLEEFKKLPIDKRAAFANEHPDEYKALFE
jgi:dihydroxyacetone kinase